MSKFPGAKLRQTVWDGYLSKIRWEHAILGALLLGVLLRLVHFSFGRMLWLDEAMVALNLQARDGVELLAPLDFKQIAPIGWLVMEDWFVSVFHNFEYGSRLPALFAGVASLFLFYKISRKQFSPPVAFVSVFVFSTSFLLVYFSAELKPYGFDVLLWALAAIIGLNLKDDEKLSGIKLTLISMIFLVGSFATFAAPAVIGGIGSVMILRAFLNKDYRAVSVLSSAVIISAGIYLFLSISFYQTQAQLGGLNEGGTGHYFNRLYAPFPPTSLGDIVWYPQFLNDTFGVLFGVESAYIFILLSCIGGYVLFRKNVWTVAFLLAPLVVAFILSALKIYPIMPRLVLYFIPIVILLACWALQALLERSVGLTKVAAIGALAIMCAGSLGMFRYESIFSPTSSTKDLSVEISTIAESIQPGEVVAVSTWSLPAYLLYRHKYGLGDQEWVILKKGNCLFSPAFDLNQVGGAWLLKGRFDGAGFGGFSKKNVTVWHAGKASFVSIEGVSGRLEFLSTGQKAEAVSIPMTDCFNTDRIAPYLFGGAPLFVAE